MARTIIEARVIRWELSQDNWGVAIRKDDHTRVTYPVGGLWSVAKMSLGMKFGGVA